jgi:hypothetical protein
VVCNRIISYYLLYIPSLLRRIHTTGAHVYTGMTTDVHQVGQKGPGLPTVVLAIASVREGGANIVSTAMQSWGGTASQMPMTASHVSSLSLW